eukprot:tig00021116_g18412.t1
MAASASASLFFGAPVSLEVAVAHIRAATRAAAAAADENSRDATRNSSRGSSDDSFDASDAGEGAGGWLALNMDEAEAVLAAAAAAAALPASLGPLTLWEVRPHERK